jgi:hypothetical protein
LPSQLLIPVGVEDTLPTPATDTLKVGLSKSLAAPDALQLSLVPKLNDGKPGQLAFLISGLKKNS